MQADRKDTHKEPTLIFKSARGTETFEAITMQHVGDFQETVLIEVPFYAANRGAESVVLQMSYADALELATRMINVVSHNLKGRRF